MTEHTLEVALFKSGRKATFEAVMKDLSESGIAKRRAKKWKDDPDSLDAERMVKDIAKIGKGRFAQRWASRILANEKSNFCPDSIRNALSHVVAAINQ